MNNENQNPNNSVSNMNPNPVNSTMGPVPNPAMSNPMNGGVNPVPPVPPMSNDVTPMMNAGAPAPGAIPPMDGISSGITSQPAAPMNPNPVPPAGPINLQPAGTVVPEVPVSTPEVAQPLMGSTLNDQTVLNAGMNPNPSMPNAVGAMPNPGMPPNPGMVPPAMMGGIPAPPSMPTNEPNANKKKPNMTLILVLVIVLIVAVGFGVYYFLNTSQNKGAKTSITAKLMVLEAGSEIDLKDPLAFVNLTGIDASTCTVTTDLNPMVTGNYQFSVTCGSQSLMDQMITVSDSTPPVVTLKDVTVAPNTVVSVEDFIESIEDFSDYTADFADDSIDTSSPGEYTVTIVVTDDFENETTVEGNLIVSEDAPSYYLVCEEEPPTSTRYNNADLSLSYHFGMNTSGESTVIDKVLLYVFENEEEYLEAKADIKNNSFDGYKGTVVASDNDYEITVTISYESSDLEQEYNISPFPSTELEIDDFYANRGGSCYLD